MSLSAIRVMVERVAGYGDLLALARKACGVYRREGLAGIGRKFVWLHAGAPGVIGAKDYADWIQRYDSIDESMRKRIHQRIREFQQAPLISIVMPVYNPKPEWLADAIESVRAQLYSNWELCIADDRSTDPTIRPMLERFASEETRIKVVFREQNGHISAASNSALALASGAWIALLDHDDLLPEHALYCVADAIERNPSARMVYSDEDKIDISGRRREPYFKCDWNSELFLSHNMFSHFGVFRSDLLREVGGFRIGYEGSQDYDLALRCIERVTPDAIHHIPRVLYHWRLHATSTASGVAAKPYAAIAGEKAIAEHLYRRGVDAATEYIGHGYRVRYTLPQPQPLVSVIVLTRDAVDWVRRCISSLTGNTAYRNIEILIVDNGSTEPRTFRYFESLAGDERIRILRDDRAVNFSALNNTAVRSARGELVALLSHGIEVVSPDWLSEMVGLAIRPDVGAVGAKLLYPNGSVQHAGLVLGIRRVVGSSHKHVPRDTCGYFGRAGLVSAFSAVTAACVVMRKSLYLDVGGLNEQDLAVSFNDVDLCLRIGEAGYRNVWTPFAELIHHESAMRDLEDDPAERARFEREAAYMIRRWGERLSSDPYYSPNLSLERDDFSLARPPRVPDLA